MNKAFVFQHNTTGVQIFVYHAKHKNDAISRFSSLVIDPEKWVYIGLKVADDTTDLNDILC